MADITRWDPFSEMATLRQTMDRIFDDARPWRAFSLNGGDAFFPVDLYETNDEVVVKASLPGVRPEDIEISVTGQVITIKGETKEEHEDKSQNYYRHERRSGTFMRQLQLPSEVDSGKAAASFEHGVLRLALPKAEAVKPKTIKVQATPAIEAKSS
ncbi:MAG TPA: Hsp20/alpha crystallin family protein [Dehalococcoidia bacterium]|nr:Hsp20/alpha crystallin family protein [Dehalococcoidia bacterium]